MKKITYKSLGEAAKMLPRELKGDGRKVVGAFHRFIQSDLALTCVAGTPVGDSEAAAARVRRSS